MKKTAMLLILISLISKFSGLLRDIVLSYFYGASIISDAYLISQTIPIVIFSFIGIGIATGYMPMYTGIKKDKGVLEANKFTTNLLNSVLILCFIIIIFTFINTEFVVKLFASGFEGETLIITRQFTRISIIGIIFISIVNIFSSFLQINDKYIISAISIIPMNLIIILSIILSSKIDIKLIAIGSVIAIIVQVSILVPSVDGNGYKYKFSIDFKDENIKKMLLLTLPTILGIAINDINVLIDRTIASNISIGGISALNYANQINRFIHGVFVLSIATIFYPTISKLVVKNDIGKLKIVLNQSITGVLIFTVPSSIGILFFSEEIIRLLFERGAFDLNAMLLTSSALFFYAFGIVGTGLREILSRPFYSMKDTKTPTLNAMIGMLINIILNIILSKYLGIGGLALATSISAIITSFLLIYSLRKKIGSIGIRSILFTTMKIMATSIIMGVIARVVYNNTSELINYNLALIISIIIGVVTYFSILIFMKIEEVDLLIMNLKARVMKN